MSLDKSEIAVVKGMLARGDKQHDIAAFFGVNGGRIAEIKTGHNGAGVTPAPESELPPAGPIMSGRSALKALSMLQALRGLIDECITEIEGFEGDDR